MLVISRKVGESIQIGDDITLTITRIGSRQVHIGIDAPRELSIARIELLPAPLKFRQGVAPGDQRQAD